MLLYISIPLTAVCLIGTIIVLRSKWYKPIKKELMRDWELYLFLLIPVAFIIIFHYVPMFGVQIAFRKYRIRNGIWGSEWVGFYQFQKFFKSPQFKTVVPNTIILSLYNLLAGFPLPIILALALNVMRNQKYKKTVQMVTYIPHFISTVVLVAMIISIANPRIGLYGILMKAITGNMPADPMGKAYLFRHLYVWSGVWQNMGWSSIIYLAALSAVDMELHEAAQIDGASRFRRTIHIDLPTILPTAIILLIMSAGRVMSVGFEKVYLMQNDLNKSTSEIISTYVYYIGMVSGTGDFSYSTAIDLFNAVINLTLLILVNTVSKKVGETSLW
ncbi:MAG: sugar ABC transporter permease [Clostridia bacterium]|nr:sugar ABC transporter permease [Clostridia bacterium]